MGRGRTQDLQSAQARGGAGFDIESNENFQDMLFHRGLTDAKDGGDIAVGFTLGDPKQRFGDPRCEFQRGFERFGRVEIGFELGNGLLGGAIEPRANGGEEVGFGDGLGQVVVGAQVHSCPDVRFLTLCGEEDERNGDGSGITAENGKAIFEFLAYDSKIRKKALYDKKMASAPKQ